MGMKKPTVIAFIVVCMSLAAFCRLLAAPKETIPIPITEYPGRNVPIMGDAWSEAGTGYYDPRSYQPPRVSEGSGGE